METESGPYLTDSFLVFVCVCVCVCVCVSLRFENIVENKAKMALKKHKSRSSPDFIVLVLLII